MIKSCMPRARMCREMIGRIMVPKGSRASYLCEHNHNATTTVRGNTRARSAPCYVKVRLLIS